MRATRTARRTISVRARARLTLLTIAAWLLPVVCPATLRAEPELRVAWSTPRERTDCPDQSWLLTRVAEQLGRPPRPDVPEGVQASASIEAGAEPGSLLLSLRTGQGEAAGERQLPGSDCRELSEAAALIVALAVAEARERESARPAPPAPAQPEPAPPKPTFTPRAPRALFVARADVLLQVGLLDQPSLGPALSVGVAHGIWRGELTALWLVPRRQDADQPGAGGVEASLWAGRLTGCALWGKQRLAGGPCLAAELGEAYGEGRGSPTVRRARSHTLWAAAALGARTSLKIVTNLALVAQADLLLSIARPRFVTVDAESGARSLVHEPSLLQLRASLGLELRF